jgi:hypothetical protein
MPLDEGADADHPAFEDLENARERGTSRSYRLLSAGMVEDKEKPPIALRWWFLLGRKDYTPAPPDEGLIRNACNCDLCPQAERWSEIEDGKDGQHRG